MVTLRDMQETDILDYVRWFTEEKEWMFWDSPCEKHETTKEVELKEWTSYFNTVSKLKPKDFRNKFEIAVDGKHIGWVSCYKNSYSKKWGGIFIGVIIPEQQYRNNGYGTRALQLFIEYLIDRRYKTFYMETWSGNEPMKKVIEKLRFNICAVDENVFTLDGISYDKEIFRVPNPIRYENNTYYHYLEDDTLIVEEAEDLNSQFLKKQCKGCNFGTDFKKNKLKLDCTLLSKNTQIHNYYEIDVSNLIMPHVESIYFQNVKKIIGLDKFVINNPTIKWISFGDSNISLLGEEFWSSLNSNISIVIDHCTGLKSLKGLKGIKLLNIFSSYIKDEDVTNLYKCESAFYRNKEYKKVD
mgnify:CR=1 FL=1